MDRVSLASYVANCVHARCAKELAPSCEKLIGTVLFADISGFTPLTERFALVGPDGAEELTKHLNAFFSILIDHIVHFRGDIIKFAGDAILVMWPGRTLDEAKDMLVQALLCAMILKNTETNVVETDSKLCVKVTVGFGEILDVLVGMEDRFEHLICGNIIQAQLGPAGEIAQPGQVILSRECYEAIPYYVFAAGANFVTNEVSGNYELRVFSIASPAPSDTSNTSHNAAVVSPTRLRRFFNATTSSPHYIVPSGHSTPCTARSLAPLSLSRSPTIQNRSPISAQTCLSASDTISSPFSANDDLLISNFLRFMPMALSIKLKDGHARFIAELRRVTVLFVKLPDFDTSTPEFFTKLQVAYQALYHPLVKHGGSLRQFIQDDKGFVFIAVFGLQPEGSALMELRGLRCALDMRKGMEDCGMDSSIGVTTGRSFCTCIGNETRKEFSIIGDSVNLSARLMCRAGVGHIWCDLSTRDMAHELIMFEERDSIHVKGKHTRIEVFEPFQTTTRARRPTFLGRKVQQPCPPVKALPLIGRETQIESIQQRTQQLVDEGVGGTLLIGGETGIGKSSLLTYATSLCNTGSLIPVESGADAVSQTEGYAPWRAVFAQLFDVNEDSDIESQIEEVLAWCRNQDGLAELAPLLAAVMPFDIPENGLTMEMRGEVRADNTCSFLVRVLNAIVEEKDQAMVIFLDDAQWMDEHSWRLTLAIAEYSQRILLVFTVEASLVEQVEHGGVGGGVTIKESHTEMAVGYLRSLLDLHNVNLIMLDPLSRDAVIQMACSLLDCSKLSYRLSSLFRDRAQGNPFIVQQMSLALASKCVLDDNKCLDFDSGSQSLEIPNTVEGMITSRLDSLSATELLALKVASVCGVNSFELATLLGVFPIEHQRPELQKHISHLVNLRIMHRRRTRDSKQRVYFLDSLTREIAYNQLAAAERKKLHLAVAEHIERTHERNLQPRYSDLIHHYHKGCRADKEALYLALRGLHCLQTFLIKDAVRSFKAAIRVMPDCQDVLQMAKWHRYLGQAYFTKGKPEKARNQLFVALNMLGRPQSSTYVDQNLFLLMRYFAKKMLKAPTSGKQNEAEDMEVIRCLDLLSEIHYFDNDLIAAGCTAFSALRLAQERSIGPCPELARIYSNLGLGTWSFGSRYVAVATICVQFGVDIAQALVPDVAEHEPSTSMIQDHPNATLAYSMLLAGQSYVNASSWDEADRHLERARLSFTRLGDFRRLHQTFISIATAELLRGKFEDSMQHLQAAVEAASAYGGDVQSELTSTLCTLLVLLRVGQFEKALEFIDSTPQFFVHLQKQPDVLFVKKAACSVSELHLAMRTSHYSVRKTHISRSVMAAVSAQFPPVHQRTLAWLLLYSHFCSALLTLFELEAVDPGILPIHLVPALSITCSRCFEAVSTVSVLFPMGKSVLCLLKGRQQWAKCHDRRAIFLWQKGARCARTLSLPFEEAQLVYSMSVHVRGFFAASKGKRRMNKAIAICARLGISPDAACINVGRRVTHQSVDRRAYGNAEVWIRPQKGFARLKMPLISYPKLLQEPPLREAIHWG